ncbi:MAG: hypothetical protein OEM28_05485 [Nitrosopumilus sp.]|nr:hypothetical protein [Nitrosopumilus sp.]
MKVSYHALMKTVNEAKKDGLFRAGPRCKEILSKYKNRMIFKFGLSKEFLDDAIELISDEKAGRIIGGGNPFAAAAGVIFYYGKDQGEQILQDDVAKFFEVTNMSVRNFREKYKEIMNLKKSKP